MEAKELHTHIDAHDAPVIVDARTSIEYKHGHVPGAISAPLGKVLVNTAQPPNEPMVVTCHGGERAWIARKVLAHRGYRQIGAARRVTCGTGRRRDSRWSRTGPNAVHAGPDRPSPSPRERIRALGPDRPGPRSP